MALRRRWTVLRFTDTVDSPGSSASAANVQDVYTAEEEGSPWKSCVAERGISSCQSRRTRRACPQATHYSFEA